jgi:hypothetical protein
MKIGHYVVQRQVGAGAMGEVFLAHDPNLDRRAAVKVLPPEVSNDAEHLKRFLREAQLAARLHHTNVATVYEAGSYGGLAFMAMEFVEGTPLNVDVTKRGRMPWREATRTIRDAAAGLSAAHAIGLVHRDVKPANLIRTNDGVTKVVDFGLATTQRADPSLNRAGVLQGTPAYMPPEQWLNSNVDSRSDLYSLSLTYYFLLTGRPPFDAPKLLELATLHGRQPLPDPRPWAPDLPDEICRLLIRGAAKRPVDRFRNAEELIQELDLLSVCPDETLTFGTAWGILVRGGQPAAIGAPSVPVAAGGLDNPLTSLPAARSVARPRPAEWPWLPWVAGGAIAAVVLLLLLIVFAPRYGLARIVLKNADPQVQVTIDDRPLDPQTLQEPLRLKVGEHRLVVNSPTMRAVSQSFPVQRNDLVVVEIPCVPKSPDQTDAPDEPRAPPKPVEPASGPRRAVFQVEIHPADALLAVSGKGASVEGHDRDRVLVVDEANGQTKVVLLAQHEGYRSHRRELQPTAGESGVLRIVLEAAESRPGDMISPPRATPSSTSAPSGEPGQPAAPAPPNGAEAAPPGPPLSEAARQKSLTEVKSVVVEYSWVGARGQPAGIGVGTDMYQSIYSMIQRKTSDTIKELGVRPSLDSPTRLYVALDTRPAGTVATMHLTIQLDTRGGARDVIWSQAGEIGRLKLRRDGGADAFQADLATILRTLRAGVDEQFDTLKRDYRKALAAASSRP